jgi:hypothetical protein
LRPFDQFPAVVAADAGGVLNRLHALHIQHGGARVCVAAHTLALGRVRGTAQAEPEALEVPAPEMIEHGLPGWEVCGEIPPRAPSTQDVEDGVEDITQAVGQRSAASGAKSKLLLDVYPLRIRGGRSHRWY